MNAHDQFRDLAESYALGALDHGECAAFEAHLATCPECARAVDEARLAVSELAYLAPPAEPSREMKQRLLQQVQSEAAKQGQNLSVRSATPWWLWAGVAALLLFSLYSAWDAQRLQTEIRLLHEQAALERHRRETLEKEYLAAQVEARFLMDPRSKKIMLPAKDPHVPQLEAMWNPELGLCLMGHDVPMPGEKRAFQLWLIPKSPGSKPMPVHSMMWPDAGGKLMHVVEKPPGAMWDTKAIAITEEPAGGSEQPTGEPMWSGSLG